MRGCVAFVRVGKRAQAWSPCARAAIAGDRFCAMHRDALDGAFLGLVPTLDIFDDHTSKGRAADSAACDKGKQPSRKTAARREARKRLAPGYKYIAAAFAKSRRRGKRIPGSNFVTYGGNGGGGGNGDGDTRDNEARAAQNRPFESAKENGAEKNICEGATQAIDGAGRRAGPAAPETPA